jgi:hypothetical protein
MASQVFDGGVKSSEVSLPGYEAEFGKEPHLTVYSASA